MYKLILFLVFLILPFGVFAQEAATDVTVDKDNVKQLIQTLESETARQEFIGNLKTLMEAQEGEEVKEPGAVPLTQALGINKQTRSFMDRYRGFLARNNLNGTWLGKTALTAISFLIAALLVALVQKVSQSLQKRFNRLRLKYAIHHNRFRVYTIALRYLGYIGVLGLLGYGLGVIWDIKGIGWLTGERAVDFLGQALGILLIVAVAIIVWEGISGSIDYGLKRASDKSAMRMRTLLPIIKSVLFLGFTVMFALVLLSELGINVLPLLAGAGIVGIAIGFGAQTMVKDFISGFTVVFEDLFHVGDVVNIAGVSGVVEAITLRKVQLRDVNGAVFTIPYSEVTVIENRTKDFSYYLLDITAGKGDDVDKIEDALRVVDASMRNEEAYSESILEPLEIMGVDRFTDNAMIYRARVKTKPGQQWTVGREYNRRIKDSFAKRGLEMPLPQQVVWNRFPEGDPSKAEPKD